MTEYAGPERRHPDPIQEQIETAIREAHDPKDRAFLLIMNKIAQNLEENTSITRKLSTDLDAHTKAFTAHEEKEMALINQGRGFWRAALGGIVVFQAVFVWWIQSHLAETKRIREDVDTVALNFATHKAQQAITDAQFRQHIEAGKNGP